MLKNILYKLKGLIFVYIVMGLVSQLMNVLSIVYFHINKKKQISVKHTMILSNLKQK